jgi:transcription elongation factor GreA
MPPQYLTKEGFEKLQGELDMLVTERRKEVAARLKEAAENSLGEFVEDSEFEAAKNEQAFVEGRIRELEILLADAHIIEKNRKKKEIVEIGCTVIIKEGRLKPEEYMIVGAAEANPRAGMISNESPLGKALLGKKVGDKVDIKAPNGDFTVTVKEIK